MAKVNDENFLVIEKFSFQPNKNTFYFGSLLSSIQFRATNLQSTSSFSLVSGSGGWNPSVTLPTGELTVFGAKLVLAAHYEIRDFLNSPLPPTQGIASRMPKWIPLPPEQNALHDNGIGEPEIKYIHPDGREAVYDGDTGLLITDPKLAGTYNYINPGEVPYWFDGHGWNVFFVRGAGHVAVDVIPYMILGNERPELLGL